MGRIIDTSAFIRCERGKLDIEVLFPPGHDYLAISTITFSELWVGVHRTPVERREKRQQFIEAIVDHVDILDFDMPAAEVHAKLAAVLQTAGTKVGDHDLLIAATAIRHDLELLSFDERSFPRVPGLKLARIP